MKPKRILILGGSPFQVPLIERAKKLGLYVITCDYLPENPGHKLSDEYHNVSTTDRDLVLELARKCNIDAITTFSSDPAVPTVAYVAEQLGLPGPSLSAIERLTEKDKFRSLMKDVGLNVPECFTVSDLEVPKDIRTEGLYIVKPVDSSGSKGITKTTGEIGAIQKAISYALSFSRQRRCIIESYIDGKQIHGDAFVQNGKVIYLYLGDHYFYTQTNSFIPISTRWPTSASKESVDSVKLQVEKLLNAAGYRDGPVNIEARIDRNGLAYIIEIGPRNGGNYVPIIQNRLTGFDFTQAVIDTALNYYFEPRIYDEFKCGAHYIMHAQEVGSFETVEIPVEIKPYMFFMDVFKSKGDQINPYTGSNETVGVCLFEFDCLLLNQYLNTHPPKVIGSNVR